MRKRFRVAVGAGEGRGEEEEHCSEAAPDEAAPDEAPGLVLDAGFDPMVPRSQSEFHEAEGRGRSRGDLDAIIPDNP